MSLFEIITITLSFVLGISASHILWSTACAIRDRRHMRLHWIPLAWAGCIFMVHIQYWFAAYQTNALIEKWAWLPYLILLLLSILLFFAGALVLPRDSRHRPDSLFEDFQTDGRLGLMPLAAYHIAWIPTGWYFYDNAMEFENLVNIALFALVMTSLSTRNERLEAAVIISYAALFIYASVFMWAPDALTGR